MNLTNFDLALLRIVLMDVITRTKGNSRWFNEIVTMYEKIMDECADRELLDGMPTLEAAIRHNRNDYTLYTTISFGEK